MLCFLWRSHVYFDPNKVYKKKVKLATIRIRTDQNEHSSLHWVWWWSQTTSTSLTVRRLLSIIWPFWPYDRFLCSQSLHGFVRNQEKVSQAYEMSVSKKRVGTKRTALPFFVWNRERFPLLLETNHAFRIVIQTYFNFSATKNFGQHDSRATWPVTIESIQRRALRITFIFSANINCRHYLVILNILGWRNTVYSLP